MGYSCKIILDSISQLGIRLTTIEVTIPRIVLAEMNTHRVFSRNSASSRAIPVEKMLKRVQEDPFIPVYWGMNQKGMQANQELSHAEQLVAERTWLKARDQAVKHAKMMLEMGLHKQITNRLLEPWLWHTIIVSATEYDNFFGLRLHSDAQPEIRKAAVLMNEARNDSTPTFLQPGEWHLPLVTDYMILKEEGYTIEQIKLISVGRCARVSYLTHNGTREPQADIDLAMKLQKAGHMSPFEHPATPLNHTNFDSNFRGWRQYRKEIPNEDNFMKNAA